ncbi:MULTISPECIES: DUF2442 domain-containing protein [unclassified Endozoicomonas]
MQPKNNGPTGRYWEVLGEGDGIYWPELDEDLSVEGLVKGTH